MERLLVGSRPQVALKVALWLLIINACSVLMGAGIMVMLSGR